MIVTGTIGSKTTFSGLKSAAQTIALGPAAEDEVDVNVEVLDDGGSFFSSPEETVPLVFDPSFGAYILGALCSRR